MRKLFFNDGAAMNYAKELTKIALEQGIIKATQTNPTPVQLANAITTFHHQLVEGLIQDIKQ